MFLYCPCYNSLEEKQKMANKGIIYGLIAVTALGIGVMHYIMYKNVQSDNKENRVRVEELRTAYETRNLSLDKKIKELNEELKNIKH